MINKEEKEAKCLSESKQLTSHTLIGIKTKKKMKKMKIGEISTGACRKKKQNEKRK